MIRQFLPCRQRKKFSTLNLLKRVKMEVFKFRLNQVLLFILWEIVMFSVPRSFLPGVFGTCARLAPANLKTVSAAQVRFFKCFRVGCGKCGTAANARYGYA